MAKTVCPQCGAKIGESAAFCIFCGAKIETAQEPPQAGTRPVSSVFPSGEMPRQAADRLQSRPVYSAQSNPLGMSPSQSQQPQQKAAKAPISLIVGICAVVVVVLVVLALFFIIPMLDGPSTASKASVSAELSSRSAATSATGATPPAFSSVTVSSQLPGDADTADYGASNLTDGKSDTAWNEGAAGEGVGEWVRFSASSLQRVTSVSIMGGFPKLYKDGSDVYQKNPRPKEITVSYEGGSQKFTMEDLRGQFQTFTFAKPIDTTWVTITIDSVYPGSKYEDCCIAEVEFQ